MSAGETTATLATWGRMIRATSQALPRDLQGDLVCVAEALGEELQGLGGHLDAAR